MFSYFQSISENRTQDDKTAHRLWEEKMVTVQPNVIFL